MIYDPFSSSVCDTSSLQDKLDVITSKLDESPEIDFTSVIAKIDAISTKLDSLPGQSSGGGTQIGVFASKSLDYNLTFNTTYSIENKPLNLAYFYGLECNASCRIRAYHSQEALLKDINRTANIKPNANEAIFDLQVNKANADRMTFYMNPIAIFAGTFVWLIIDNLAAKDLFVSIKYVG